MTRLGIELQSPVLMASTHFIKLIAGIIRIQKTERYKLVS